MSRNIFNRYKELARKAEVTLGTKESADWFRKRIRKDSNIKNHRLVSEDLKSARTLKPGMMVTYIYDPKLKDKLPFYDNFPLIIILDVTKDGWYGANLHYLPPTMRSILLYELEYKNTNALKLAKALANNPMTAPCLKRYLAKQTKSKLSVVPKEDWEIAIQLPFESFQKESQTNVWRHSKRKI